MGVRKAWPLRCPDCGAEIQPEEMVKAASFELLVGPDEKRFLYRGLAALANEDEPQEIEISTMLLETNGTKAGKFPLAG